MPYWLVASRQGSLRVEPLHVMKFEFVTLRRFVCVSTWSRSRRWRRWGSMAKSLGAWEPGQSRLNASCAPMPTCGDGDAYSNVQQCDVSGVVFWRPGILHLNATVQKAKPRQA